MILFSFQGIQRFVSVSESTLVHELTAKVDELTKVIATTEVQNQHLSLKMEKMNVKIEELASTVFGKTIENQELLTQMLILLQQTKIFTES